MKRKAGITALVGLFIVMLFYVLANNINIQPQNYHQFADNRSITGINNFADVLSNLIFFIPAWVGLKKSSYSRSKSMFILSLASAGIALGSGYYHLNPNNYTLVWDRLPMTLAFMAIFTQMLKEFVWQKSEQYFLWPLLLAGILSVAIWRYTNFTDLRWYAIVQFYPIFTVPVIAMFFNKNSKNGQAYFWLFLTYVMAKVSEHFDKEIFELLKVISGHSIKHILAGTGIILFFTKYRTHWVEPNKTE